MTRRTPTHPQLGPVAAEVARALAAHPPGPRDQGAVALALTYAKELDMGGDLAKLGPALLACLDALQMTPRARAVAQRGGTGKPDEHPATTRMDELRARRAGKNGAAAMDAPAP